ncbi:hypothetical protein [Nonomuraea sp. SYSU D8015]|uniref:hypothetical protein n=1 Tax=Nonomuraea sp. SYSU D8015 TaxID=2593644 RepID=UPI0016617088|nr:hypothetical protein [Nonomuraea sp. SYSU D8015]
MAINRDQRRLREMEGARKKPAVRSCWVAVVILGLCETLLIPSHRRIVVGFCVIVSRVLLGAVYYSHLWLELVLACGLGCQAARPAAIRGLRRAMTT